MDKTQLFLIGYSVVSTLAGLFLANKTFKFKDALWALIVAAKDGKIDEAEFQNITDNIRKDLY